MKQTAAMLVLVGLFLLPSTFWRHGAQVRGEGTDSRADLSSELAGAWSGSATREGETVPVGIEFESLPAGNMLVRLTLPTVYLERTAIANGTPQLQGDEIRIGMLTFRYDRIARTLSGNMPEALVPVYRVPLILRRVDSLDDMVNVIRRARSETMAPLAAPSWTFDAGAPCWPGATFSDGLVFAGCDDGQLHALDARTGRQRWSFRAGGPIRARVTVSGSAVYFQSDDGLLYKLGAADGVERWRVRLVAAPVTRLPLDDPKSRFDRFASDVTVAGDRLDLGTHDGRVVAINSRDGAGLWEFRTADSVTAAPAVVGGRVYAGSFDKHVYALDQRTGALIWKRDTQGAVVSTPAPAGKRLIVGNRAYDLLGLDADSGDVAWRRYIWFSWVESSPTVRGGVAYVGSSDAAAVFAFDAQTGRPIWKTDVRTIGRIRALAARPELRARPPVRPRARQSGPE
jgi:outer membrane protein assembly factor BamB